MRMKNLSILFLFIAFIACKEVPPPINYEASKKLKDTTYTISSIPIPQAKNVLIEDISGVQCVNCPDAAVISKQLMDANPDRVFSIVAHPNLPALKALVEPINKEGHKSKYDFRTGDAVKIIQMMGVPGSLPSGYINRKLFTGETSRILGRAKWANYTNTELPTATQVNIDLHNEFNSSTNKGVISIKATYTSAVNKKQFITIALIEDSLIDVQEYSDPITFEVKFNPDYVHMHVLRDVITYATGDPLSESDITIEAGRVFEKEYAYDLKIDDPTNNEIFNVVPKNAKLIVFIHEDTPDLNILQVKEIAVVE